MRYIDNREKLQEISLERRQEALSLLGLGVLVFSFNLLLAWQHFSFVRNAYEIEKLRSEFANLEERNHQLRLESSFLSDPSRIEAIWRVFPEHKYGKPQLTWPIHNPPTSTVMPR